MLTEILIRGYRSIKDAKLDLRFDSDIFDDGMNDSRRYEFFAAPDPEDNPVPVMALYGANASGKTAVLQAVQSFLEILKGGVDTAFFHPNLVTSVAGSIPVSEITLRFATDGSTYSYFLQCNAKGITEEKLTRGDETLFHAEKGLITDFTPALEHDILEIEDAFQSRCIEGESGAQKRCLLSFLAQNFPQDAPAVKTASNYLLTRVNCFLRFDIPIKELLDGVSRAIDETQQDVVFFLIEQALRKFGIPVEEIRSVETEAGEDPDIMLLYRTVEGEFLNCRLFEDASRGTQRLFFLAALITTAIETGGVLLVDEFDASLSPSVVRSLVSMFTDKHQNPNGAQLIFTANSMDLLDVNALQLCEVSIVERHALSGTRIRKLSDIEGFRSVSEFRKQYLYGEFTGNLLFRED
jgi:hypothetical protein